MSVRGGVAEYSIAAVSKLTGVGCHTLRVWERRYGFPVPRRSPSGHRRYGADQVRVVGEVARKLGEGRPIGELIAEARAALEVDLARGMDEPSAPWLGPLLAGDLRAAESSYRATIAGLGPKRALATVIAPALIEIGERWFRGECDIYQEHGATAFLHRKLMLLMDEAQSANPTPARSAVVGTVQGDRHEGGVLMLGLLLELAGWSAKLVGCDTPAREYQKAVDAWGPDAVCLSFVLSRNVNKRFAELGRICGAPVYVGGRSVLNYQGLARRHGLRPLIGPGEEGVGRMIAEVESGAAAPRAS